MTESIIVAILSLVGTLGGTIIGAIYTSKLTAYRIEQLEKKVDKHNTLIERMYKVEARLDSAEDNIVELRKG